MFHVKHPLSGGPQEEDLPERGNIPPSELNRVHIETFASEGGILEIFGWKGAVNRTLVATSVTDSVRDKAPPPKTC